MAAGLAALTGAQTTTTVTRTQTFLPIGLAPSETAEIDVVNLAANAASGTAASCTGTISFLNASGTAIGSPTSFTATAGKTVSATLPYSTTAASGRTVIRGEVTLTTTTGGGPCQLATSMSTFDSSTGVTHAWIAGPTATAAAILPLSIR